MGSYDLTSPQSMNRYAHALNNPTSMLDPSGLFTLPTGPCDPNYSNCDPGGPSNPIGCVSWGTQGCIPYPNPGNPGNPGGGSGGGNPGPPFVFKVNATTTQITDLALQVARLKFVPFGVAPNNNKRQQQDCLNQYNNSPGGKAVQFLSLYNFANNITSLKTWAEWTALPFLKVQAANLLSKSAQAIGDTEFLSVTSGAATTIVSPTAAGISAAESVGTVAGPVAIAGATVADIQAHAACAGLYDNQQVMLAPTMF
jgi:hypothetical protein